MPLLRSLKARLIAMATVWILAGIIAAGFVLSAVGLVGLLYALSEGPRSGWGEPAVAVGGLVGLVSITLLVVVELL